MASPTAPTLTLIVTEALKKAYGGTTPSAALITRASDEWMEEVKNDIWNLARKLEMLHTTAVLITTNGRNRYSLPTDFSSDLSATILDGDTTGIAQNGSASSLTLAASDTASERETIGKEFLIIAGTGKGSCSQATAFDTTTKVVNVQPSFTTTPATGDEYMRVTSYKRLKQYPVNDYDSITNQTSSGVPLYFFPIGDSDYKEIILYPVPYRDSEKPWGLKLRYYANLMTLDLSSTLMATLYRRWRNVFEEGVFAKALRDLDDNRQMAALKIYENSLKTLIFKETYGSDLSNLRMTASKK
mgnify:CR=1 FL=1